jgi:hypothetical protein
MIGIEERPGHKIAITSKAAGQSAGYTRAL